MKFIIDAHVIDTEAIVSVKKQWDWPVHKIEIKIWGPVLIEIRRFPSPPNNKNIDWNLPFESLTEEDILGRKDYEDKKEETRLKTEAEIDRIYNKILELWSTGQTKFEDISNV